LQTEQAPTKQEITTIWNKNFICIMLANMLMCFGNFAGNPLVASYTKYLGTSETMTGFLAGMFFGVAFAIRPISGPMVTKLDKRVLLICTMICGCIANLGYALFKNVAAFAVFRFVHGLEYSFLGTLVMTIASDNLPYEKMASGMGLYSIGAAVATAVAPAIGSALLTFGTDSWNESVGFTLVFLFCALSLALSIIPACILNPDKKTQEEKDSAGAWYRNIVTVHAIPVAVVLLLLQASNSLYNTYMIEFGKENGISGVSVYFTVYAIILLVSRPMSGFLTDRFGIKKVVLPGLVLFAVSFLVIGSSITLWMVLIGAVIAAVGFGSSQPPLIAMAMKSVQPIKRGVASNTVYMGIDLGLFFGPFIGGVVYERLDYASLFKTGMAPIGLALVCFLAALSIYKRSTSDE